MRLFIGLLIGMVIGFGSFQLANPPQDKPKPVATDDETANALDICLIQNVKMQAACQGVVDLANYCVDALWEMPVEKIEEVRKSAKPEPLPSLNPNKLGPSFTEPATKPDGTVDVL